MSVCINIWPLIEKSHLWVDQPELLWSQLEVLKRLTRMLKYEGISEVTTLPESGCTFTDLLKYNEQGWRSNVT